MRMPIELRLLWLNVKRLLHGQRPWSMMDYFAHLANEMASRYNRRRYR